MRVRAHLRQRPFFASGFVGLFRCGWRICANKAELFHGGASELSSGPTMAPPDTPFPWCRSRRQCLISADSTVTLITLNDALLIFAGTAFCPGALCRQSKRLRSRCLQA